MSDNLDPATLLAKLVAFPTVSSRSNLDLIHFVRDYLARFGIESVLTHDASGKKASLHARIGPAVDGGVVLSGHTDVVPVEGQSWTSDPFTLRRAEDGRLFGRGAADMKGFSASILAAVPDMVKADLKRPIHIALSYDEEVGCFGAPPMIDAMLSAGPKPDICFIGEPTSMHVVTGQKGISVLETIIHGHSVHSSRMHQGVSAVSVAARLVNWLDACVEENRVRADTSLPFDPPYTTLHCGVIQGGTALNITAAECRILTDIRTIPGETPREWQARYEAFIKNDVVPAMQSVSKDTGIIVNRLAYVPGLNPEKDGAAETLARQLTGDNSINGVVFASEAGQFQEAGISTVLCGPGSIEQAHQVDEFIDESQLQDCVAFLGRLTAKLSA